MRTPVREIYINPSAIDRFWKYTEIIPFHSCWEWIGTKANGYGILSVNDINYYAHRVSLKIHGIELVPSLVCDHTCMNRACVNPRHLRQVTLETNVLENSGCLGAINRAKTHCKYGHILDGIVNGKHRYCKICDHKAQKIQREKRKHG